LIMGEGVFCKWMDGKYCIRVSNYVHYPVECKTDKPGECHILHPELKNKKDVKK